MRNTNTDTHERAGHQTYLAGREQTLENERNNPLAYVLLYKLAIFGINLEERFAIVSAPNLNRRIVVLHEKGTPSNCKPRGLLQ